MARQAIRAGAAFILLATAAAARADPLPPVGPVSLCGTIVTSAWQQARTERGIPGVSGTLGIDRTFPAGFLVVLEDLAGIDAATAKAINVAFAFHGAEARETPSGPQRVRLFLKHDEPGFLEGAKGLCVDGLRVAGDEGGTWTQHTSLRRR